MKADIIVRHGSNVDGASRAYGENLKSIKINEKA